MESKDFPLCGTRKRIPMSIAERAYEEYVKKFGRCQTLERLGERGGFWPNELDELYPQWREHVDEIYLLRKEVETLRACVEQMSEREKKCPTMAEAESRALLRTVQEIAGAVGLNTESSSPRETVEAVLALVRRND
jgi:hypothetical protein